MVSRKNGGVNGRGSLIRSKPCRILVIIICIFRLLCLLHGLHHKRLHSRNRQQLCIGADGPAGNPGSRHECSALCHIRDPVVKFGYISAFRCAQGVEQGGGSRNNVRRIAAIIQISVVHAGITFDMLPQVVDAHVHKFTGI